MEVTDQLHTAAALTLGKSSWKTFSRRLVGSRENLDIFSEEYGVGKTKHVLSVQSLYKHCYPISSRHAAHIM